MNIPFVYNLINLRPHFISYETIEKYFINTIYEDYEIRVKYLILNN